MLRTALAIALGIFFANIALEAGLFRYLHRLLSPIFRRANISPEVASSALARIFSPSAGYSALAEFHKKAKVSETEIFITAFITSFPYELIRIFKFYLPVAVPLLGFSLGIKYISVKVGSGLIQSLLAVLYARNKLEARDEEYNLHRKGSVSRGIKRAFKTTIRVLLVFTLTYTAVRLLLKTNAIQPLAEVAGRAMGLLSLPGESSLVVATQFMNVVAGFATASELLKQGLLNQREVLITLVVGLVISLPRIYLQHTFPVVVSLFSKRIALKLMILKFLVEGSALLFMLWVVLRWS